MKLLATGLLAFSFSISASVIDAIKAHPQCKGSVKLNKTSAATLLDARSIRFYEPSGIAHFKDPILDFAIVGKVTFAITRTTMIVFENGSIETVDLDASLGWPNQIYPLDGKVFISRDGGVLEVLNEVNIPLEGNIHGITHDDKYIYVLADTSGVINGAIHNSIFVLDRKSYKVIKETKIYSNPTGHIELKGSKLFVGSRMIWQLDLETVMKKNFISTYKSVFNPQPAIQGRPFRDDKYLYYCEEASNEIRIVLRSTIEK